MDTGKIILIISNIAVPIIVAVITGLFTSKKYKNDIKILEMQHQHELEKAETQYKHDQELMAQKLGIDIVQQAADKLTTEIVKQPATQKMINQRTTNNFLQKKGGRK